MMDHVKIELCFRANYKSLNIVIYVYSNDWKKRLCRYSCITQASTNNYLHKKHEPFRLNRAILGTSFVYKNCR